MNWILAIFGSMAITYGLQRVMVSRFPRTMSWFHIERGHLFWVMLIPFLNVLVTLCMLFVLLSDNQDKKTSSKTSKWHLFLQAFYGTSASDKKRGL